MYWGHKTHVTDLIGNWCLNSLSFHMGKSRQSHTVCVYIMSHVKMSGDIIVFPHVKVWVYMWNANHHQSVLICMLRFTNCCFYFTVLMQTLSTPYKYRRSYFNSALCNYFSVIILVGWICLQQVPGNAEIMLTWCYVYITDPWSSKKEPKPTVFLFGWGRSGVKCPSHLRKHNQGLRGCLCWLWEIRSFWLSSRGVVREVFKF